MPHDIFRTDITIWKLGAGVCSILSSHSARMCIYISRFEALICRWLIEQVWIQEPHTRHSESAYIEPCLMRTRCLGLLRSLTVRHVFDQCACLDSGTPIRGAPSLLTLNHTWWAFAVSVYYDSLESDIVWSDFEVKNSESGLTFSSSGKPIKLGATPVWSTYIRVYIRRAHSKSCVQ